MRNVKVEMLADKEVRKFLRKCGPYKMEFKGYKMTYVDYDTGINGEILLKYKLEKL